ncbi:MAG: hypothetical protein QOE65_1908 [Solirubrobacteraceae bacterium]|nr:hypothetical protein [Solirubrobacteraceae bacterium]
MPEAAARELIVNADDFGLTAGVNRAVREAHHGGILTSTTVLVTGVAAHEAADLPHECPELSVGLHVNFSFSPASDPADIPSLVDADGRFLSDRALLRRLVTRRVSPREVGREVTAQAQRLRGLGVTPTHWDAHRAVAFWPGLCAATARAAHDAGIPAVRTPRIWTVEPGRSPARARWRWRFGRPIRFATEANRRLARHTLERRFALPDWRLSPNLVESGADYVTRWRTALATVPPGTSEIVSHPAYVDDELRDLTPGLTDERATDLTVLTDPSTARDLAAAGTSLRSYRGLGT